MSRYLVDTHVWLWLQAEPDRLTDTLRTQLSGAATLFLSAASAWEIAIKYGLGRLPLPEHPRIYVPARLRSSGTTGLAVEIDHVHRVTDLPPHHRDPFDRLLIAQAQALNLPIVTADERFGYYDVQVIEAG
ncbi:MAG: type II toxin-antitoxin system VapC family toxin [Geodermatophilaceae bacterium]|nr:type II toxin-antitoxin system VapC family toxin [Geodermatophilaceae bacterium]MDQ3475898.1 type II toxin-antitoxin system VapC family toxin [Actinomycetota bacterium]